MIFGDDTHVPVHAPTSGFVKDISFNIDPIHPNQKNIKIIILSDYLDKWIKLKPIHNYKKYSSEKLIQIIYQSGIVGMGGGQFSSSEKLILSIHNKAHTLIVNAVESEPYITSDDCLIQNYTHEFIKGCKIICWISKIKKVLIAIQEDRIESIKKLYSLIKNESYFDICILKKKYPGGSSNVLIKSLTGKEIPYNKHAINIGYLIFNVATVYAIKRAISNGEPLTERIVTFLGDNNSFSGNFWTRIGTPIKYFLNDNKFQEFFKTSIYLGGPFMGKEIYNLEYSVLKKTNCISIQFIKKKNDNIITYNCIRCSYCSNVCPVNLLPQQLYLYSKNNFHKQAKEHHILDCIECKACEKVCPSNISLVKFFKKEKNILKSIYLEEKHKKLSFMRFKFREKRLLTEKKNMNMHNINNIKLSFINKKDACYIKNKNIEKNMRKKIIKEAIERIKSKK